MRTRLFSMVAIGSLAAGLLLVVGSTSAQATVAGNAGSAVSYAHGHGYRSSIGVLDTQTGAFWGAGDYNSAYASESVMKVFIATRLLLTNQMSGWNQTTAYKMITQSDDASANALYGRAGGDSVITWVKQALNIPNLGAPPLRSGWWGGTQINAYGMSLFYKAVRARPTIWNWLGNAMHHATTNGSDGTYQFFGIPSATSSAAIKQGWGGDNAAGQPAFNSTGVVNGDRYAVVILTQGGTYGAPISGMVTTEAKLLMPGGKIANDSPDGVVDSIGVYGNHATARGWSYDPNAPSSAVKIVVYLNGKLSAYGPTTVARPDINASRKIAGTHGYQIPLELHDGANTVCVYATNIGAGQNSTLGCRSITLSGSPVGSTTVRVSANQAAISGWAYDYDVPNNPLKVVVYVNGRLTWYGMTTDASAGVNASYRITGTHAYSVRLPLPDGSDTVCVYAINQGTGQNSTLGCPVAKVSGSPIGMLDTAGVDSDAHTATVTGWTYDYDAPATALKAVLYLNGRLAGYGPTTVQRDDVNDVYGLTGSHGYSFTVALPAGRNQLCMYGINTGAGSNTQLGCRTVTG
jgi:phage baseplate assembly protein gpV